METLKTFHSVYVEYAPYILIAALIAIGQYNSLHIGRLGRRLDHLENKSS